MVSQYLTPGRGYRPALDTRFSRGVVAFSMSYHPAHAHNKILDGSYPDTMRDTYLEALELGWKQHVLDN